MPTRKTIFEKMFIVVIVWLAVTSIAHLLVDLFAWGSSMQQSFHSVGHDWLDGMVLAFVGWLAFGSD